MERGVCVPREAERAQARVSGVRREPVDARRLPRDGGVEPGESADGARGTTDSGEELPATATQVSGVCFIGVSQLVSEFSVPPGGLAASR